MPATIASSKCSPVSHKVSIVSPDHDHVSRTRVFPHYHGTCPVHAHVFAYARSRATNTPHEHVHVRLIQPASCQNKPFSSTLSPAAAAGRRGSPSWVSWYERAHEA